MPGKHRLVWSICAICKRPYQVRPYDLRRKNRACCSRTCGGKNRLLPARGQDGSNTPNWKGGRTYHSKGYVYAKAPDHPRAWNGYVLEHILVAEAKLGRYLEEGETVHHKNEIKDDNSPDNIEVYATPGEHTSIHTREHHRDEKGRFISKEAVAV